VLLMWNLICWIIVIVSHKTAANAHITYVCEVDWPSASDELASWKKEMQGSGNRLNRRARRGGVEERTVYWPESVDDEEVAEAKGELRSHPRDSLTADIANLSPPREANITTKHAANSTSCLTYPTNPDSCCYVSSACWNFFAGLGGRVPEYLSLEWKQAQCCYQRMVDKPSCKNPPPKPWEAGKVLVLVNPPFCLV
jgi:hypothetical protein